MCMKSFLKNSFNFSTSILETVDFPTPGVPVMDILILPPIYFL